MPQNSQLNFFRGSASLGNPGKGGGLSSSAEGGLLDSLEANPPPPPSGAISIWEKIFGEMKEELCAQKEAQN